MADSDFYSTPADDAITHALQSRRIPHSRSKRSGRGGGGGKRKRGPSGPATFDPLRALGRYTVQLGAGGRKKFSEAVLRIHELTVGDDGLIGTFDFERIRGMCVFAGSRRGLVGILEGLEDEDEEDGGQGRRSDEEGEGEDDDDDGKESDHESHLEQSSLEIEDEKINRRIRNFEKNSFRNPKFWFRWRGRIVPGDVEAASESSDGVVETNTGYIVFSGNDCDRFEGTITSETLGWDNLKLRGQKIDSHPTTCTMKWTDIV